MSHKITLRVRPDAVVRFPNRCVACGRPGTERHTLQKRHGSLTRRLDVPLCAACARQAARRSSREEQLLRTGRLAAVVAGVAMFTLGLLAGGNPWLRGLAGLIAGGAAAALVWWAFRRRALAAQLPETRAVREAARIVDFTWRDMTLAFTDETLAAAVAELNPTAEIPYQKATTTGTDADAPEPL